MIFCTDAIEVHDFEFELVRCGRVCVSLVRFNGTEKAESDRAPFALNSGGVNVTGEQITSGRLLCRRWRDRDCRLVGQTWP